MNVRNNGLKLKIIVLSVLFIMLPVILMGIFSYHKTYDLMLDITKKNAQQLSRQLAENINLSFREIERFASLRSNVNIIRFLLSTTMDERTYYSFQIINLFALYRDTYRFSSSIGNIVIIGGNGCCFSERMGVMTMNEELRERYMKLFAPSTETALTCILDPFERQEDSSNLRMLVGAPVFQTATNDVLGVLVLELDVRPFTDFTAQATIGRDGRFLIGDHNHTLFNENGILPSARLDEEELELIYTQEEGTLKHGTGAEEELVLFSTIDAYHWKVIGRVMISDVMAEAMDIKQYTWSTAIICLAIAALLNVLVIRWLFIPMDKLKNKMAQAAEGNLNVKLSHRSNDEIAQLNHMFNTMVEQIRELMQRNHEEQEKLKKSQLRVLQAQINPHFLYNTLDALIWLINGNQTEKAIEMVDALSTFFRISLSNGNDFISVSEELAHVSSYLAIQKARNGDRFEYEIDVEQEILNDRIMKLMIQPLAENAISHGLKPKQGGKIWIKGWLENGDIVFTVRDNGQGIEQEKCRCLQETILAGKSQYEGHYCYGLFNVQQRISLYYGTGYGLTLEGRPGVGMSVMLRVKGGKEE